MQINITGHHVEVTPALRAYVTEKMQRLTRHFDQVSSINVILNVEKLQQQAEATVKGATKNQVQVFMPQPDQVKQRPIVNLRRIHSLYLPAAGRDKDFIKCFLLPGDIPWGHTNQNDLEIALGILCNALNFCIIEKLLKVSQRLGGIGEDFYHGILKVSAKHVELPVSKIAYASFPNQMRRVTPCSPGGETHKRGLAIGQKNAPDQTKDLVGVYDFAVTEDAFYYGWAEELLPFIQAGKPVFAAESTDQPGDFEKFCEQSQELGFSTILNHRDLDVWLKTCPWN